MDGAGRDYHEWRGEAAFRRGESSGTEVTGDGVRIGTPSGVQDGGEYAWWTSPDHELPFDARDIVVSWNATTPPGTWLTVELRARTGSEQDTAWYSLGRWAYHEMNIRRTSVADQRDEFARVEVDRVVAAEGHSFRGYRIRVTLCRAEGTAASPTLLAVGAAAAGEPGPSKASKASKASKDSEDSDIPGSVPGPARGIELPVPRYAQYVHNGHFPEYGGGGEAWCSPASTEMVVEYWGAGPTAGELSWVPREHPDRSVVHAARHTFDHAYGGTGNWSFNVAYAAQFGLTARVLRLVSLADVERYLTRGIPVITSQSFERGELDGADYATAGHLLVVVGFTEDGDVVVHDPAAEDAGAVRRVYPRAQFENVWLRGARRNAEGERVDTPGGVAYVISRR